MDKLKFQTNKQNRRERKKHGKPTWTKIEKCVFEISKTSEKKTAIFIQVYNNNNVVQYGVQIPFYS